MSLRVRIAVLIGMTVLIASTIAGIGTALSSRNVGRDRLDQELSADAARFPPNPGPLSNQLNFAFDARRASCAQTISENADSGSADGGAREDQDNAGRRGQGRRRFLPEFASALQLIGPQGTIRAACQQLPVSSDELAIAESGTGRSFRTVSIEGERLRILTQGYDRIGAVQFARSLELTEDTLRGLMTRIMFFGAVGAVLASALGWIFSKRTTDPVLNLKEAAQRVALTRDLGERIDVERDDEIGALATSFNTMMSSLDASREQQQQLVQDASHELRTPLTSIRTNVELLQRHVDIGPEVRGQVLADIASELAELSALTAELVESATEIPTNLRATGPVDLITLATETTERSRRRHHRDIELDLGRNAADVDADGGEQSGIILGDEGLLARAITNLINNAVKFSADTTPITVAVTGTSVAVLDRGQGIPVEDLDKIFDRFHRAVAARSAPGSGLGLAIVKQIVEGHGGQVHAANRDGGGAEIGFRLPARTIGDNL